MDKKEREKELQRIVSLTFDEKPEVRKQAALRLAQSDEPAALFALFELSYDKDEAVKAAAREILSKKPPTDKNAISFAEIFAKGAEPEEPVAPQTAEEDAKKRKLLSPVEHIFEKRLGKEKAALMRSRMMPTIEKIYLKAVESKSGELQKPGETQKREKSIQRMLTSYADVLSGLDRLMFDDRREREGSLVQVQTIDAPAVPAQEDEPAVLEEVGMKTDTSKIAREVEGIADDEEEVGKEISREAEEVGNKSVLRRAYEVMMASDGDEEVMFQQSQRLIRQLEEDVKLAFKMAKQRFKAENITHLTELRNGMRNINTEVLAVKTAETGEYQRTKTKKDRYARIVANDDEGSEGIIYLFEGRGQEVRPGMRIRVMKGQVKTFSFSGETAITIGKKGNVYIVL